jgi:hypothetical protein
MAANCELPAIREAGGFEEGQHPLEFSTYVYGAKFDFVSGSPGYVGDLHSSRRRSDGIQTDGPAPRQEWVN